MSLIPALILLFANRFGAGVSPDSAGYILMADAIQSKGYAFVDNSRWPPLFPLLLSVVHGLTQHHYSLVGHWINVLSLFATAYFTTKTVLIHVTGPPSSVKVWWVSLCSSFVALESFVHLRIGLWVWSEPIFVAALSAFLYALCLWRVRPGSAATSLPVAFALGIICWTLRHIGILALGVLALDVVVIALLSTQHRTSLMGSKLIARMSLASLILASFLVFNKLNFGLWMVSTHPPGYRPVLDTVVDHASVLSLALFPLIPLSGATAVCAAGFTIILQGGLFTLFAWMAWQGLKRSSNWGDLLRQIPVETLVWVFVYEGVLTYLHTTFGISGANRFVAPAALPILLLVLFLPARQGWFLPFVAFLVIVPNVFVTVATVRTHSNRIEDRLATNKNIYDPGVIATAEYERLAALTQSHQVYFFVPDESERHTARIFRAQFVRYSPKETRLVSELSAGDLLVMSGNSSGPPDGYRCPESLLGLKVCFRLDVGAARNVVGR